MIKRLAAALLSVGLLAVTAVESFHAHAAAHDRTCAACTLETRAPATVSAPVQARAPVVFVALLPTPAAQRPSFGFSQPRRARAPPAAA